MAEVFDPQDLLGRYEVEQRTKPHLRVNFVTSLDGAATHNGLTAGLNNEADHQVFHTLRMLADVVLVGAGTVRKEGYEDLRLTDAQAAWRADRGLPHHPVMAVVSRSLGLDAAAPLFARAPVRPLVFTTEEAPRGRRRDLSAVAEVITAGRTAVQPEQVVAALIERGLPQILSEGGPTWFGNLIAADVVDEMCLTLSPLLEGGPATRIAHGPEQHSRRMSLVSVLQAGDMLILRYLRRGLSTSH